MTLIPSLTFTDYEWFPRNNCNGCDMPLGNAYPSGHLVPSPIVGHACAPIVVTRFLELAMSLLDFSPRIPLGTFSILLVYVSDMVWHQLSVGSVWSGEPQPHAPTLRPQSNDVHPWLQHWWVILYVWTLSSGTPNPMPPLYDPNPMTFIYDFNSGE